jgi:hypothetical protein
MAGTILDGIAAIGGQANQTISLIGNLAGYDSAEMKLQKLLNEQTASTNDVLSKQIDAQLELARMDLESQKLGLEKQDVATTEINDFFNAHKKTVMIIGGIILALIVIKIL